LTESEEATPPIPVDLARAIADSDDTTREIAQANWLAIGADGRARYIEYLGRGSHRHRAQRVQLAVLQLLRPEVGIPRGGGSTWGAGVQKWLLIQRDKSVL
jgi:hypothetical protein